MLYMKWFWLAEAGGGYPDARSKGTLEAASQFSECPLIRTKTTSSLDTNHVWHSR